VQSPGRDVVHCLSASRGGRRTRVTYRLLCVHATVCLRVCVCSYCVWIAAVWSVVVVVECMGSNAKVGYVFWCVGRALVPAATRETASSATLERLTAVPRAAKPPPIAPAHAHCFVAIAVTASTAALFHRRRQEPRRAGCVGQHAHRNSPHSAKSADTHPPLRTL
jgi:hypothetical protein